MESEQEYEVKRESPPKTGGLKYQLQVEERTSTFNFECARLDQKPATEAKRRLVGHRSVAEVGPVFDKRSATLSNDSLPRGRAGTPARLVLP